MVFNPFLRHSPRHVSEGNIVRTRTVPRARVYDTGPLHDSRGPLALHPLSTHYFVPASSCGSVFGKYKPDTNVLVTMYVAQVKGRGARTMMIVYPFWKAPGYSLLQ